MFESMPIPERPAAREEVIQALKAHGKEDPSTKATLEAFINAAHEQIEKIADPVEHIQASFALSISNAELFFEAGFLQEALDDLNETGEAAYAAGKDDVVAQVNALMDRIELAQQDSQK